MADKLIIALHTPDHANRLCRLLENEGISVSIQPVDIELVAEDLPVAMEIDIEDLPEALRIIENIEIFSLDKEPSYSSKVKKTTKDILLGKKLGASKKKPVIVVPVDFSDYSLLAARFAFPLAQSHGAKITLLHSFVLPSRTDNLSLSPDTLAYEPVDMELDMTLEETAKSQMENFTARLREFIKKGVIPPVKFDVEILEGLPETVINDYARDHEPLLIVMGTRGANKKDRELVGSITAEVLDTCRYPVFTVPENSNTNLLAEGQKDVVVFCNLDNDDIMALNTLFRIFPEGKFHVTLYHIATRKDKLNLFTTDSALKKLEQYCQTKFKGYTFSSRELQPKESKDLLKDKAFLNACFIVVPNKRRYALARLFNPSMAHRLVFHTDIPMLEVPV